MLDSAVKALLEPFWSLEKHVVAILFVLLEIIPLIAIRVGTSQKVEGTIPLGIMVMKAKEATFLLLELLGRSCSARDPTHLLGE